MDVPDELQAILDADPKLATLFGAMAPSHRRAWTAYIGGAVRPETRRRRAEKALAGIRARAFPNG
ncbi:MAG: YdeI/OmpD-associated family protein [Vicinamibacteria bacterium]|nr:YdeI/OmpD-associated family protein [Vicinamibacteria bacterium]